MKKDIHPEYSDVTFNCLGCGNIIQTRSTTKTETTLGVCSGCHPFFTGKHKLMDTAGRVDRFRRKYGMEISSQEAKQTAQEALKQSAKRAGK